jgi:histidine triad (HIT) family protein
MQKGAHQRVRVDAAAAGPTKCLFCGIAAGATSAVIVDETPDTLVFLDHRPVFVGHCLVIPKAHYETLTDLPVHGIAAMFAQVQRIARAVEEGLGADGTFVGMNNRVSQSVPHLHVHVVPRRKKDGLRGFFWPRVAYASPQEAEATRDAIRRSL